MKASSTNNSDRSPSVLAVTGLLFLLPIATFAFGGVHLEVRLLLTFMSTMVGLQLAVAGRYGNHRMPFQMLLIALFLSATPLIPVNQVARTWLHGSLATPVQEVFDLFQLGSRPLALDPSSALLGWSEAMAYALLGIGVAGWCTRARRSRWLLGVIVTCGVAVVGVRAVHIATGMTSIYGSSVGLVTQEGSYPPFVNPNHAGMFCAAALAAALPMVFAGSAKRRLLALCCIGILAFGVWSSGSRGAVFAAALGVALTVMSAGGRNLRLMVGGALLMAGATAAVTEPTVVVHTVGEWVAPSVNQLVNDGYVDITTGRLSLWSDGLAMVGNVWPLGVGAGGFDQAYRMLRSDPGFNISTHAHNEPLQLLVEHGAAVAVLVMCLIFWVYRLGFRASASWSDRRDRQFQLAGFVGCLSALMAASLVSFPFRLHSHGILMVLCLGGIVGLARPHKGGHSAGPRMKKTLIGMATLAFITAGLVASGDVEPYGRNANAQQAGEAWFADARGRKPKDPRRAIALDAAAQHFERAVARDLNRRSFQWLARTRVAQGEPEAAIAILTAATKTYPTMPWLWRDRARLAQRLGDHLMARNSWRSMLAQDLPGAVNPVDVLHEALFGGEFESPIAQARSVLPERADRYRQAARVMDELGLQEESETLFRHALALEPEGVLYFADALYGWGRYADAVMLLEPHSRKCPGERLLAQALAQIGRHDEAAESFAAALGFCGAKDWQLRVGLVKARLYSGDPRGADVVEKLLIERPEAHGLRRAWLWVLSTRGRTVEATRHLEHLQWAGVISDSEKAALERARIGFPFSLPELAPPR